MKTTGRTRTPPGRERRASPPKYSGRSTTATQRRQRPGRSVFGSMIAELVAHAGDNPDDAGERGKENPKTSGP